MDNSGADNCGGPLTRWDPNTLGEVVMVQDDAGEAQVVETKPNSSWVS